MHLSWLFIQNCRVCYRRPACSLLKLKQFHSSVTFSVRKKARVSSPIPGAFSPPTPDERLKLLKSGEKTVAVIACVSLLVGYFALKRGFSAMASGKRKYPPLPVTLPVLVVAGPSGSGKSTLLHKLFAQYPEKFSFSISHTTRRPRSSEKNGKEYHFTTREAMQKAIDAGEFIEWAEYSGNLYGTSVKSVMDCQRLGKVCVLDIDMQGVRSIKATELDALYVNVRPPSLDVLEQRLAARKTDSAEAIAKRIKVAKTELEYAATPGAFDHIIVNDDVERAYKDLDAIILEKWK